MLLNWNNDEFSLEQAYDDIFNYYKDEYENYIEGSLFKLLKGKEGYTIH
jgi:hypothetical protein